MPQTVGQPPHGEDDAAAPALDLGMALDVAEVSEAIGGDSLAEAYADESDLDVDLLDWRVGAACGSADVEIFFPPESADGQERLRREAAAKEICAGCPVRVLCLLSAMVTGDRHGIWGGTTPAERLTNADGSFLQLDAA
ncbi:MULTISPECIES: WhiB family transcriptional regulator [Pseudofrankia]|uniref:WhiB family transcriptional regulator n=1 Tax=Pseudofrankia TaxID=2994363 RepID=UPI0002F94A8A|nr:MULTISPECIES: WhiB family transcriptional regulator [Pseudofrankia]